MNYLPLVLFVIFSVGCATVPQRPSPPDSPGLVGFDHGGFEAVQPDADTEAEWVPSPPPQPVYACRRADGTIEHYWWNTRTKRWRCRP